MCGELILSPTYLLCGGEMKNKRRKIIGIFVVVLLLCLAVDASLLFFYGRIETTVNIKQSIILDGEENSIVTETFDSYSGCIQTRSHVIENRGDSDICILLEITDDIEGILVSLVGFNGEWFVIEPNEIIYFDVLYEFDVALESGVYEITVEFLPYDGCTETHSQDGTLYGSFSFRNVCSWKYVDGWNY